MATHTTFLSLVQAQESRFAKVKNTLDNVSRIMAREGYADLKELTEGGLSKKVTRGAFARGLSPAQNMVNAGNVARRPKMKARIPLRPINKQSGKLHRSIRVAQSGKYSFDVSVSTPYAKYILHPAGTKKMVGRGVMSWRNVGNYGVTGELEKRHRARVKGYRLAVQKATKSS